MDVQAEQKVIPFNARQHFHYYLHRYGRAAQKLQSKLNVSKSENLGRFFDIITDERDIHTDQIPLLLVQWYFEEHTTEAFNDRLDSSAFLGRLINIAALRYLPETDLLRKTIDTAIKNKDGKELEKALRPLDKKIFPTKTRAQKRKEYIDIFAVKIAAEIGNPESLVKKPEDVEKIKTLFREALNTKDSKLQEAILLFIFIYFQKSQHDSVLSDGYKQDKLRDAFTRYAQVGGQCQAIARELIPDAAVLSNVAPPPPARSLTDDVENPATSSFRAALKEFGERRVGSHYADIATALCTLNTVNFLRCLYVIIDQLLRKDFDAEKFESSAFIGRLINAASEFIFKGVELTQYQNARFLLAPDKSFSPKERQTYLKKLRDAVGSALEYHKGQLPEAGCNLEKVIAKAIQKTSEKKPKYQQTLFCVMTEHLNDGKESEIDIALLEQKAERKLSRLSRRASTPADSLLVGESVGLLRAKKVERGPALARTSGPLTYGDSDEELPPADLSNPPRGTKTSGTGSPAVKPRGIF